MTWYKAPPTHSQILISLDLITSAGLTLMTSWDSPLPQRFASTQQVAARLGIPWDICWVASDPALQPSLNLYLPDDCYSCPPGDSLRIYLMQIEYQQRCFQWLSLTGSGQAEVGRGRSHKGTLELLQISPRPGAAKSQCWYAAWSFPHTPRLSRGNYKL